MQSSWPPEHQEPSVDRSLIPRFCVQDFELIVVLNWSQNLAPEFNFELWRGLESRSDAVLVSRTPGNAPRVDRTSRF